MRGVLFAVAVLVSPHAARADDAADAKAIIERAIKARGDKPGDKLPPAVTWKEKITTNVVIDGNVKLVYDSTWTFAPPDKVRIDLKLKVSGTEFEAAIVLNGERVWVLVNGSVQENGDNNLALMLGEMTRLWASALNPLLADEGFKLSTAKEQKVNGKPAAGVEVRNGTRPVMTLYFDKETGLLVKRTAKVKTFATGDKDVHEDIVFSGYKETADGRKFHTRATVTRDGEVEYTSECTEPKALKQVDAKLFEKPKG